MTVRPRIREGFVLCPRCLAPMTLRSGRDFRSGVGYLWLVCDDLDGHVSDLLPIPSGALDSIPGVIAHGDNALQIPRLAESPPDPLHD